MGGPAPVGRRSLVRGLARTVANVAVVAVLYYLVPLDRPFTGGTVLAIILALPAFGLLIALQVRAIMRSATPALRAIEAVSLSLPLFLLLFAAGYVALSGTDPQAFTERLTHTDGLYFVVTVFSTVGFGDIAPVSELARVLTTVQMLGDLVLIGLVLKLFLAAVDRGRRHADAGRAGAHRAGAGHADAPEDHRTR